MSCPDEFASSQEKILDASGIAREFFNPAKQSTEFCTVQVLLIQPVANRGG
jgi:hypothetical protein